MGHTFGASGLAAALLAAAAFADPSWTRSASAAEGFSIDMPAPPEKSTFTNPSPIGSISNELYTAVVGAGRDSIDHSQLPHFALEFAGRDKVYDFAKGSVLREVLGREVSFGDVTVAGVAGKQLAYGIPPVPGKPEPAGLASIFLVGNRLYVVDSAVPAGASEADAQRFLSSVRFR